MENQEPINRHKHRLALSTFFFLMGFCFSSWASRIPTIKENLSLSEAELGTLLLLMPISAVLGIPTSGWLVSKFDSRIPIVNGLAAQTVFLLAIGLSNSVITLAISIFLFAFSVRVSGVAVNTQAIHLQGLYQKRINGSFHALWSVGGIAGILVSSLMVYLQSGIKIHFVIVCSTVAIATAMSFKALIRNDKAVGQNKLRIGKPDMRIVSLGLIVLCAAICEGGMFDWSGIYFSEVVGVSLFTTGYLTFMTCMALSRFLTDKLANRISLKTIYVLSAILLASGLALAITWPYFWSSIVGFALVGFGTASIIPITYMLVGKIDKYSPGVTISILSTYGLIGIFIGPPMIGYIAHASSLRISFGVVAIVGLLMIPFSRLFFSSLRSR